MSTGVDRVYIFVVHRPISHTACIVYCRSSNNRDVFIFANFAKRTNWRILESHENYFYISVTIIEIDNSQILDFTKIPKSQTPEKSEHAKMIRSTLYNLLQ